MPPDEPALRTVAFVLPFVLESLNVRDRKHFAERHRAQDRLCMEVMAALGGPRHFPRPPIAWCRITVVRHGKRLLDPDNLAASNKGLLDVLCERSARHPHGLGIIRDDHPKLITLDVRQRQATGDPVTAVRIDEMPQPLDPLPPKPAKARMPKFVRQRGAWKAQKRRRHG
jgi:hypothetical protein